MLPSPPLLHSTLPNQVAVVLEGNCDFPSSDLFLIRPYRDAFCLFYDAKTKSVKALNGSGRSPQKLTMDHLRKQGITGSKIPLTNLNSVTVPGAAAAWVDTVENFGNGKVTLTEVLAPAIRLAEEGSVTMGW